MARISKPCVARKSTAALIAALSMSPFSVLADPADYDLVIYGGTSGGMSAALQAQRMGKTVAIIAPHNNLGGMSTSGLSFTDVGEDATVTGISREFYQTIGQHYGKDIEYFFEPQVAQQVYDDWAALPGISVFKNERIDLSGGVTKTGSTITALHTESGQTFTGSMFIDASYEGDLLAQAGVSYTVGREANSLYGETLNSVNLAETNRQKFNVPVDPYKIAGDPSSGLLSGVSAGPLLPDGTADGKIQAYNFRLTVTKAADRIAWSMPSNYNDAKYQEHYELMLRNILADGITNAYSSSGGNSPNAMVKISTLQGGKYDLNNSGPVSTDYIGANYDYAEADHATRQAIIEDHYQYQMGMMYFLANDPRVPQSIRDGMNELGMASDEFTDTNGWSPQLYIREARRMIGEYVTTELNATGQTTPDDSIALSSYALDSHHVQRVVIDGQAVNEGNFTVNVDEPFEISYRSITPQEAEASNLLVTSAVSASHAAYGSIRMEPVFMMLGQAAGTAAALSIDEGTSVQGLEFNMLQTRLIEDGMLLNWPNNRVFTAAVDMFSSYGNAVVPLNGLSGGENWGGGAWADDSRDFRSEYDPGQNLAYNAAGYQNGSNGTGLMRSDLGSAFVQPRDLMSMAGTVWASMLVRVDDEGDRVFFWLDSNLDSSGGNSGTFIGIDGGDAVLRYNDVAGDSQTVAGLAAGSIVAGQTYLFLTKIELDQNGENDLVSFWLNPDLAGGEDGLGDALLSQGDADALGLSLDSIGIQLRDAAGTASTLGGELVDAIRISNRSTGFMDVTAGWSDWLVGDIDGDGQVDSDDLALLAQNWESEDAAYAQGDINADGMIDAADLAWLEQRWGDTETTYEEALANTTLVPEPSSITLV